jgi:phage tail sheath gpL-like
MADLIDVQNALIAQVAQAVYPNGTGSASVSGANTAIYGGWPQASQLDADLAAFAGGGAGRLHVTVFPSGTESNTTRYMATPYIATVLAATIALAIAGQTITLSGTIATPQNVALLIGGIPYLYAVQASDTLTSIATALASMVPGASNAGTVITVPTGVTIEAARAGGSGVMLSEIRRQKKVFQVTVWADTPSHRDVTAAAVDLAMAAINFLTMPDTTGARLTYQSSHQDDGMQRANLYRRDLMYCIEYGTTQSLVGTEVVTLQDELQVEWAGVNTVLQTITINE